MPFLSTERTLRRPSLSRAQSKARARKKRGNTKTSRQLRARERAPPSTTGAQPGERAAAHRARGSERKPCREDRKGAENRDIPRQRDQGWPRGAWRMQDGQRRRAEAGEPSAGTVQAPSGGQPGREAGGRLGGGRGGQRAGDGRRAGAREHRRNRRSTPRDRATCGTRSPGARGETFYGSTFKKL